MEIKPISYKKVIYIINGLISLLGEIDEKIIKTQKDYNSKSNQMYAEYNERNRKFENDCQSAINSVQRNSRLMIEEANKIKQQIVEMDKKLLTVDKYYAKTKKKKLEELANKKSDKFSEDMDYFEILKNIKQQFTDISKKYSTDILPSLFNGLNYIFSSKRKKDYEELIILQNTVESFVKEIENELNSVEEETMNEMKDTHNIQKQEMLESQKEFKEKTEREYRNTLNNISEEIERRFNELLPEDLIKMMANIIEENKKTFAKVNTTDGVQNDILYTGYIDFNISEFVESKTLISFVMEKCKEIIVDGKIRFPLISSIGESYDIYIEKNEDRKMVLNQMVQGIMFSFLSLLWEK